MGFRGSAMYTPLPKVAKVFRTGGLSLDLGIPSLTKNPGFWAGISYFFCSKCTWCVKWRDLLGGGGGGGFGVDGGRHGTFVGLDEDEGSDEDDHYGDEDADAEVADVQALVDVVGFAVGVGHGSLGCGFVGREMPRGWSRSEGGSDGAAAGEGCVADRGPVVGGGVPAERDDRYDGFLFIRVRLR